MLSPTFVLLAFVVSLLSAVPVAVAESKDLQAGVAVTDITPPVGYRICGYFYERPSTGVHDPLHAKAIAFSQGGTKAVLVITDLTGLPAEVADPARKRASEKTGIPLSNITIGATHTHTAPLFVGALRNYLHDAAVAQNGRDPRETIDYPQLLVDRLVEAIVKADAALKPVELHAGMAKQDPQISFHRRYFMKDGSVCFNPGFQNPDIDRPCGPIDPDVGILSLREPGAAKPSASLVVFANHADTTGGTEFSADYPYYLDRRLKKDLGDGYQSIFAQGTTGNINHFDVSKPREEGKRTAEQIGNLLGDTVAAALPKLLAVSSPALLVKSTSITVPIQHYSEERIRAARELMVQFTKGELPPIQDAKAEQIAQSAMKSVEAYKIMDIVQRWGPTTKLEIQVIRISSDVALVALPGEIFVEFGLAIKKASPFKTTLVMELCNANPHYIPTKEAFGQGGYEPTNSRVESGSGEKLTEAAIALLKEAAKP